MQRFNDRMEFKDRLRKLLSKFDLIDKKACFVQWKRGAFFMRTCELIYTYRYKEEEDQMT